MRLINSQDTNITRQPRELWASSGMPDGLVIQPWDFDTTVDEAAVQRGDTLVNKSAEEDLARALANTAAWGIFPRPSDHRD